MKYLIKTLKITVFSLLGAVVLFAIGYIAVSYYPNFHTVIPQKIYRSAQMSRAQYIYYIDKYHIKSVLNLELQDPNAKWYRDEMQVMKLTHAQHFNYHIDPKGAISSAQLTALAKIIDSAPKPLLIHCWRGADRTGLGSVMALILLTDQPLDVIRKQLSWTYGVVSPRSVGLVEMTYYQRWLQQYHLHTSREEFFKWINTLQTNPDYQQSVLNASSK